MHHLKYYVPLLISVIILLAGGCKPMPNDGIPFYLSIDSARVETNNLTQGWNTQGISDIWVEANATNLGAYEVPTMFPVLAENEVRFILSAGVKQSGQAGVRVIYPFYQPDTFSINAVRNGRYTHNPVFRYKSGAKFAFQPEDFELSNGFNGMAVVSDSNVAYGTTCGMIAVSVLDSSKTAGQIIDFDLPEGQEIWIEFDYKSDVPFWVGYFGLFGPGAALRNPVLFVNPKSSWNKLYVKISESVGSLRAETYQLYFEGLKPANSSGGNVYIDNVKIVHF